MDTISTTNPGEGNDEIPEARPSLGYDLLQQVAQDWEKRIEQYHSVLVFIAQGQLDLIKKDEATGDEQLNRCAVNCVNEFLLDLQLALLEGKIDENQLNPQFLATQLNTYIKNN